MSILPHEFAVWWVVLFPESIVEIWLQSNEFTWQHTGDCILTISCQIHCVHPALNHSSKSSIFWFKSRFFWIHIKVACYKQTWDTHLFSLVSFDLKKSYRKRETNMRINLLCFQACGSKCSIDGFWSNKSDKILQSECYRYSIVQISSSWTVWEQSVKLTALRKKADQWLHPRFCRILPQPSFPFLGDRRGENPRFYIKKGKFLNKHISKVIEKPSKFM